MKIGIDARMFADSFTGIGRYNFELTKRFFKQKGDNINWVLFMNEPEFSKFEFNNVRASVKKVLVNASHYSFAEQWKFLKILNEEKCDLVHFTHFNAPILYQRKFVTTIHDTTISFYPGKKMGAWWRRFAYEKVINHSVYDAQQVITVSENTKKDVLRLFNVEDSKITTIWNGVGAEFHDVPNIEQQVVREKYHLSKDFLLYTGVWREHKNLVRLLKAFRDILDRAQKPYGPNKLVDLQLVITGKEDFNYPEIKQTVRDLNLEKAVKFVGLVNFEDLLRLYGSASVFVFPSLYEGFGLPPLEAMQCSTPVVASKISAIPEICGEAVHYFNPKEVDDMANKILAVLTNEDLKKKLIQKGKERVKLFSWDKCANETLKIYHSVLE